MSLNYNRETDIYCMDPRTLEEKDREYVEHMMQEPKYDNHLDKLNLMLTLIKESTDPKKTKHEKNKIRAQVNLLDWEIELDLCCDRSNQEYPNEIRQNIKECKTLVEKHLAKIKESQIEGPLRIRIEKLIKRFADEKEVGFEHADKQITDRLMKATFDVLDKKDPMSSFKALLKVMTVNFPELKDMDSICETYGLHMKHTYEDGEEVWLYKPLLNSFTMAKVIRIITQENAYLDHIDFEEVLFLCIHLLESKIFPSKSNEIPNNIELRTAVYDYIELRNFLGEDEV